MKSYRGTLLTAAVFLAAVSLSGCGDADKYDETSEITLTTSTPSVLQYEEIVLTVATSFPAPAASVAKVIIPECEPLLEYRAEGASLKLGWSPIPGSGAERVFSLYAHGTGTLSVVARGKCTGSKEDWKYSTQVDVTVTEKVPEPVVLPTPTSVTLTAITASPYDISASAGAGVDYTLSAVAPTGCTLRLSRQHVGAGFVAPVINNPTAAGTFNVVPTAAGTLTISASGWCTENPSAIVSATPLAITVVD